MRRVAIDLFDATAPPADPAADERALAELGLDRDEQAAALAQIRASRAELSRLRHRETELAVLYTSARELAEVRDVDELLQRLVDKAHSMMGTDITYLSEFDQRTHDLYVRQTAGAISPELRRLRVPAGAGLVSAIAESRAPQWVQRYSERTDLPHDDDVAAATEAEGLVAILGVPMLADGEVLGVLFAADRRERRFTAEQISMLSALANYASVVLQTARALSRAEVAVAETQQALAELTEHVQARDRSNVVHQDLIHAVLRGGGYPQVARTLGNALARRVRIVDVDLRLLASSPAEHGAANLLLPKAVTDAIEQSRQSGHCTRVGSGAGTVELVAAITAGDTLLGAILLDEAETAEGPVIGPVIGPVEERTVERAAQVAAILVLQNSAADAADRRARGELVADLLSAAPERRRDLARRTRGHGVDLGALDTVLVVSTAPPVRPAALRAVLQALPAGALASEHAGLVAVVMPSGDPSNAATILHRQIAGAIGPQAVVVAPDRAATPDGLPRAFDSALRTARLLVALGTVDGAVTTAAYLPYTLLFGDDPALLHEFVDDIIGPVLAHDRQRGTDLTATLRALVRNEGSPTKAARALSYHPNTVVQRLDRIRVLLGEDWRHDEKFFRVSMAVRLEELRSGGVLNVR
ncbi:helix-turn-helix domain-containing protein [Tomitella biformata]|uniref:helix-turn-helix domain-containing protein n=1 Tax=Tomitella biformata TaxID=630403 RepID=UPI000466955F|nr:GAF domain-containing protein [Tomitella biformata]